MCLIDYKRKQTGFQGHLINDKKDGDYMTEKPAVTNLTRWLNLMPPVMRKVDSVGLLVWGNENITFEILLPKCRAESNHNKTSDIQTDERQCTEELAVFWNANAIKDKDWD